MPVNDGRPDRIQAWAEQANIKNHSEPKNGEKYSSNTMDADKGETSVAPTAYRTADESASKGHARTISSGRVLGKADLLFWAQVSSCMHCFSALRDSAHVFQKLWHNSPSALLSWISNALYDTSPCFKTGKNLFL
jgi:hypothetical protein